jgi:three-Cys-motif partner protein
MKLVRKCPDCNGLAHEAGLCQAALDADALPARCVGDWYADKLFFMRRYAGIFTKGMKKKWPHLAYLDPFAGPGRCRVKPKGQFDDGSPLIALGLGFTHYYFSDLSPEVTAALDARARKVARGDQYVLVQPGDANVLAKDLNTEVKKLGRDTLAFAFLDPPGTELRYDAIAALTAGLPMDLLIFFPLYMNIQRQAHYRLADPPDDAQWDAYFGTKAWRDARKGRDRYELYVAQLRKLGYAHFGESKVIRDRGNRKLYILIYASKHERGEDFWNKATREDATRQRDLFSPLK